MVGTEDRRAALRRRYLSLGLGELAAVVMFGYAALTVVVPRLAATKQWRASWSRWCPWF